jgi:hypothetical protein
MNNFIINKMKKGNVTIAEYADPNTNEPIKTFVSCGIMGFYADEQEMHDLRLLLDYYMNIESISDITFS